MDIGRLYAEAHAALTRYARSLAQSPDEADDLVQQAYLRALEHADKLLDEPPERCRAYLMRTIRNEWIDRWRRNRRLAPIDAAPEPTFDEDFTRPIAEQALERLPQSLARLVRLRHFEGKTSAEIGAMLHLPPATVRTRLRAAARLLKQDYERED